MDMITEMTIILIVGFFIPTWIYLIWLLIKTARESATASNRQNAESTVTESASTSSHLGGYFRNNYESNNNYIQNNI